MRSRLMGYSSLWMEICTDLTMMGYSSLWMEICTDLTMMGYSSLWMEICIDLTMMGYSSLWMEICTDLTISKLNLSGINSSQLYDQFLLAVGHFGKQFPVATMMQ
ncbi:hypothetical protein CHS0354_034311 [Potamilus streckersoni]|uniref:Uncharacterized protein n=1 Tax=Potamilus streckersoni TaxID=2493646 RepID=A0AAE0RLU2_9BIVA|nr:hypothetical protein CHS0354_034311 [Potamilus streckersoni]